MSIECHEDDSWDWISPNCGQKFRKLEYEYEYEWDAHTRRPFHPATISWCIVLSNLLYSASSPVSLTHYSVLHSGISSQSLYSIKMFTQATKSEFSWSHTLTKDVWGCFYCHLAPSKNRAFNWARITGLILIFFVPFFCIFLAVHVSTTRTGELNSHHQQSPIRVEGIHTTGCCPVHRRDRLRYWYHHLSAIQPSARRLTLWLRWTAALFAVLRRYPRPRRVHLGLDFGGVLQLTTRVFFQTLPSIWLTQRKLSGNKDDAAFCYIVLSCRSRSTCQMLLLPPLSWRSWLWCLISKHLWNVGILLDFTAQYTRRLSLPCAQES
jgi:hypothetical protein